MYKVFSISAFAQEYGEISADYIGRDTHRYVNKYRTDQGQSKRTAGSNSRKTQKLTEHRDAGTLKEEILHCILAHPDDKVVDTAALF